MDFTTFLHSDGTLRISSAPVVRAYLASAVLKLLLLLLLLLLQV